MASSQALPPLPPPSWVVDLNSPPPAQSRAANSIPDPPGFSRKTGGKGVRIPDHPSKQLSISRGEQYSNSVLHSALREVRPRRPIQARRNRHAEAQKGLGSRPRPIKTSPYECDHDVHVRKQPANLQHHDGVYAVQGPHPGPDQHQQRVRKV